MLYILDIVMDNYEIVLRFTKIHDKYTFLIQLSTRHLHFQQHNRYQLRKFSLNPYLYLKLIYYVTGQTLNFAFILLLLIAKQLICTMFAEYQVTVRDNNLRILENWPNGPIVFHFYICINHPCADKTLYKLTDIA